MCVSACVRVYVSARLLCVSVCVRVYVLACVRARPSVCVCLLPPKSSGKGETVTLGVLCTDYSQLLLKSSRKGETVTPPALCTTHVCKFCFNSMRKGGRGVLLSFFFFSFAFVFVFLSVLLCFFLFVFVSFFIFFLSFFLFFPFLCSLLLLNRFHFAFVSSYVRIFSSSSAPLSFLSPLPPPPLIFCLLLPSTRFLSFSFSVFFRFPPFFLS